MNVLFIINIDMSQNGPSVHLLNDIIAAFNRRGHCITRVERKFGDNSWAVCRNVDSNGEVYLVETLPPKSRNYANRYLDDLKYVSRCKKIFRNRQFDAVFIQSCNCAGFHLNWLKRELKCPVYYNVQDIFPLDMVYEGTMSEKNPIYKVFDLLQKYAYKHSACVITISEDMKRTLVSLGVPEEKVKVIHNWAYYDDYKEEYNACVKKTYYDDNKYHVVYAGNIGVAQGVETLIHACKFLEQDSDIVINIIGRGSRLQNCKELAQSLSLNNIVFSDLAPQHLAQYIYNNADVNIVTLAKGIINTSLPSKTAACYRSKRPVVYCVEDSAITIRRLIDGNELIFQCPPGDAKQLAETILHIKNLKFDANKYIPFEDVLYPQSAEKYVSVIEG